MKRLLIGVVGLVVLTACNNDSAERQKVVECIKSGGDAVFSDDSGWVDFIACDYP